MNEPTGKQSLQVEPKREPLTDEELIARYDPEWDLSLQQWINFARAMERSVGIGVAE